MSVEGGAVVVAAPLLFPVVGLAVAGVAVAGLAVAATAVVAVKGTELAIEGAVVGSKLAVKGGKALVAGSQALADATQKALAAEQKRQLDAYSARFAARDAARDEAIAQLSAQWRKQAAAPAAKQQAQPQAPVAQPVAGPDPTVVRIERMLTAALNTPEGPSLAWEQFSELLATATQFVQSHAASRLVQPLRDELAVVSEALVNDPATAIQRAGLLEKLIDSVRGELAHAQEAVVPQLADIEARLALLRQGVEQFVASQPDARLREELAPWEARAAHVAKLAEEAPDVARAEAGALLADLDALLEQGRETAAQGQVETVLASLRRSLETLGYAIVSESRQGEDRRLAATHLTEKRRIVFFVAPDGQLRFDVMDGYHGEACLKILETIFEQMTQDGVVFAGPPSFDTLDETLRKVGLSFLADKFQFLAYEAPDAAAESSSSQKARQRHKA